LGLNDALYAVAYRFQLFVERELDERLTRHSDHIRLSVDGLHHPRRNVHAYALGFKIYVAGGFKIKIFGDIFASVKTPIKFLGGQPLLHKFLSPAYGRVARK
jgi:hypothetical protein